MLRQETIDLLCCPTCRGDVKYLPHQEQLQCMQCNALYPVRYGIPILLVDEGPTLSRQN